MIKALLFDFSRTILFPKDKNYEGKLNELHNKLSSDDGYNFLDHFELDGGLLNYLSGVKSKYGLYIFTSGTIQNAPEIKPRLDQIFDKIYSSEDINFAKDDPEAYKYIAKDIGLTPDEILFTDDSEENVKAARRSGISTVLYKDLEDLKSKLSKIFNEE